MKKVNSKARNNTNLLPIAVLILGILLGGFMIGMGIYRNVNSNYDALEIKTEDELKSSIETKVKELDALKEKRDEEFDMSAISAEYERLTREISAKEGEILDEEAELSNVQTGFYDNLKQDKVLGSVPLIVLGAVVIVFALGLFMKLNSMTRKNVILTVSEEK